VAKKVRGELGLRRLSENEQQSPYLAPAGPVIEEADLSDTHAVPHPRGAVLISPGEQEQDEKRVGKQAVQMVAKILRARWWKWVLFVAVAAHAMPGPENESGMEQASAEEQGRDEKGEGEKMD